MTFNFPFLDKTSIFLIELSSKRGESVSAKALHAGGNISRQTESCWTTCMPTKGRFAQTSPGEGDFWSPVSWSDDQKSTRFSGINLHLE